MNAPITILLAARADRVHEWYQDLVADRRFYILVYATSVEELVLRAALQPEVLVLDAALFQGPQVMVEVLKGLPVGATYVLLPMEATSQAEATAEAAPTVVGVWKGMPSMADVADTLYSDALARRGHSAQADPAPVSTPAPRVAAPPSMPSAIPQPASRSTEPKVIAFWSGPAGGTGRTTLALVSAIQAAEWDADAALLALAEPAVSAMLPLERVPNVTSFFTEGKRIEAIEQVVSWQKEDGEQAVLPVILGPGRPLDGATVTDSQVAALVTASREAHRLLFIDLPALVPGENVWALAPLRQATDVVLVMPPTSSGVTATVEALAVLADIEAPARVRLVVNGRIPDGLPSQQLIDGVKGVWGTCPPLAAEVPYLAELPGLLSKGELPAAEQLVTAVGPLVETIAGVQRPVVVEDPVPQKAERERKPSRQRAVAQQRRPADRSRLISIRLK